MHATDYPMNCGDPSCTICAEAVNYEMSPALDEPPGCIVRAYSSACCTNGTKGCIVVHAFDPAPLLP